eukprot:TRINITY_DN1777_c0_g1_i1.p1 TRINITY_DN1777_c0_g1~~TRINITY_DN1777_c0_g1_i1.p1  ORF type:complete len:290 (+),score=5.02 TRINITY_DN1777_c0_g1_i1:121-990(+)
MRSVSVIQHEPVDGDKKLWSPPASVRSIQNVSINDTAEWGAAWWGKFLEGLTCQVECLELDVEHNVWPVKAVQLPLGLLRLKVVGEGFERATAPEMEGIDSVRILQLRYLQPRPDNITDTLVELSVNGVEFDCELTFLERAVSLRKLHFGSVAFAVQPHIRYPKGLTEVHIVHVEDMSWTEDGVDLPSSLGPLPPSLQNLRLDWTCLGLDNLLCDAFRQFPASLKVLDLVGAEGLESLPALPDGLMSLSLPTDYAAPLPPLPSSLQSLRVHESFPYRIKVPRGCSLVFL